MKHFIFIIPLVFLLTACDTTADNNADEITGIEVESQNDDIALDDNAIEFSLEVTGEETFNFDQAPVFLCRDNEFIITTFSQSPKFDMYLASDIETGTYPLADFNSSAEQSHIDGSAVVSIVGEMEDGTSDFYFVDNQGELVIEVIPSAPGEQFVANLTGTLANNDGEAIDISVIFNLESSASNFLDCNF